MQGQATRTTRRSKQGVVISNKMQKTVVIKVDRKFRHPQYDKVIVRSKKYYAHDESDTLQVGDVVSITETRPLSKLKRWRVTEVLEKAQDKAAV
jgi:small subunit ribosomal protein S17